MSILLSPINIKNVNLRNRIVMSPMCQYSAKDGFANDWHLVHYGSRAAGGCGLIIQEATAVLPEGRITPGDLGLWCNDHIPNLKKIVDFIHDQGAVAGIQLAHAGRKASCAVPWEGGRQLDERNGGWQTLAPGDLPYLVSDRHPEPISKEGIKSIISAFRDSAERSLTAGFRVVEVHSAHGYLLQEFLSPISNNRTDEYGGSFENRTRLLIEVISAVRSVWPSGNPLFVRISSTDWTKGGWNLEDSVRLTLILKKYGVDLIDCSSGGNVPDARIPFVPGYQVPFSEAIRKTGIMTGAVGLITDPMQAETILSEGKADLIVIGRELLRNPYFPLNMAKRPEEESLWPNQYLRAR